MVAAPILNVVAELCSDPARGGSGFTMMSELESQGQFFLAGS